MEEALEGGALPDVVASPRCSGVTITLILKMRLVLLTHLLQERLHVTCMIHVTHKNI